MVTSCPNMWTACHLLWFPSRPLPLHTLCPVMMQLYSAHIHSAPIPTALMMGKWWAVISAIAGSISPASGSRRGLQGLSCQRSICVPPVPQLRLPARLLFNANGLMWRLLYYSAVHPLQPCRQKVQPKQGGHVSLNPCQRLKPASMPVQRHRQRRMPLPLLHFYKYGTTEGQERLRNGLYNSSMARADQAIRGRIGNKRPRAGVR